jgi:hypothetical protein
MLGMVFGKIKTSTLLPHGTLLPHDGKISATVDVRAGLTMRGLAGYQRHKEG